MRGPVDAAFDEVDGDFGCQGVGGDRFSAGAGVRSSGFDAETDGLDYVVEILGSGGDGAAGDSGGS